jgi:poly-gamma-glutamate capsule biosynthesis protein CapA/YwtB (metallophosphatase superfamily)
VRVTDVNSHTFSKNFTFTITDPNSNSNSPTDIILSMGSSTGNHTIAENTAANTDLGTLSTTDADAGDTFTYTLVNNNEAYFTINGNMLQLAKTVDYETTKNLSITVKVTDANSHIFSKGFDFAITDIDDTAPTDIQLSNNTLVKGQA